MAVEWTSEERARIDEGMVLHPVESGRCAALARVVYTVAKPGDEQTRGLQVRPPRRSAARWIVPKLPHPPHWGSHTLVETRAHGVDALTGADGCASARYLEEHWEHPDFLDMVEVDVFTIDPGIQDEP